ncbi:MAG: hypothetical protein K1X48_03580 [Burkholderiaceae bacterium]|nr:hypothetical protein [Burkholderiaceae bacterium]
MSVLNTRRLDDLSKINPLLLEESLNAWIEQIKRLSQQIKATTATGELAQTYEALHSLLGVSSSAGAVALPQFIKTHVYPAVELGYWPEQAQWLENIESLSTSTVEAIKDYLSKSLPA